jgi:hypothetical protein
MEVNSKAQRPNPLVRGRTHAFFNINAGKSRDIQRNRLKSSLSGAKRKIFRNGKK